MKRLREAATSEVTQRVTLPREGKLVEVQKLRMAFRRWRGEPVSGAWNKPVIEMDGKPQLAELAILNLLESDGWEGAWVSRSNQFTTSWWPKEKRSLPVERRALLDEIYDSAGSRSGCWDIYCWKGHEVLFVEAKGTNIRDDLNPNQVNWLESALGAGVPLESLVIVEWTLNP